MIGSGCQTTPIEPLPCPPRPILESISIELQSQTPTEVLDIATTNQIRLKAYAKKLEARARCDDT